MPLHKHEIGLNRLLRYLKSNLHIHQELRNSGGDRTIRLYTDASWGISLTLDMSSFGVEAY